jgi:hypothetical protein
MLKIARRGGLASGETRRRKQVQKMIIGLVCDELGFSRPPIVADPQLAAAHDIWELTGRRFTFSQMLEAMRPVDRRGGSHDSDWRCPHPECHHFNSEKRRMCAKCKALAPANGRLTRKALRERTAGYRTLAILKKHGLSDER